MFKSYVVALAKVSPRNPGCFVPETGNSEASSPKSSLFTVCLSSESNVYWNQRKLTKDAGAETLLPSCVYGQQSFVISPYIKTRVSLENVVPFGH